MENKWRLKRSRERDIKYERIYLDNKNKFSNAINGGESFNVGDENNSSKNLFTRREEFPSLILLVSEMSSGRMNAWKLIRCEKL